MHDTDKPSLTIHRYSSRKFYNKDTKEFVTLDDISRLIRAGHSVTILDKKTGEELDRIEVPAQSRYGMSSWMHEGHQYIILQTGSKLTAMALPGAMSEGGGGGH